LNVSIFIILEQTFPQNNVKNLKKSTLSSNQLLNDLEQQKADLLRLKRDLERLDRNLVNQIQMFDIKIELERNKLK
jgi:hypothetical protein